jgi:ornithine--oxo-acid transaminase
MIEQDNLLEHAKRLEKLFRERLTELQQQCALIKDVRVAVVMVGIELTTEGVPFVKACLDRRLLINATQNVVLRLLPAMNLSLEQAHEGLDILASVLLETAG